MQQQQLKITQSLVICREMREIFFFFFSYRKEKNGNNKGIKGEKGKRGDLCICEILPPFLELSIWLGEKSTIQIVSKYIYIIKQTPERKKRTHIIHYT